MLRPILLTLAIIAGPTAASAQGDATRRATRLDALQLDASKGFSKTSYRVEAGVYYRWRIEGDGLEEYKLLAPELFRESWIDQVVINDLEVKPYGLHAVEFDDEGTIDIWFMPIRPGRYDYWVEGLKEEGFRGEFVVE